MTVGKNAAQIKNFFAEGNTYNTIGKWIFVLLLFLGISYFGKKYPMHIILLVSAIGFIIFWFAYGFWAGFLGGLIFFTAVVIILVITGIIYEIFGY